jgi:RHS repeat-associated protein
MLPPVVGRQKSGRRGPDRILPSYTGFQYLRSRYYDPSTEQFLSVDPAINRTRQAYAYALNNPVNLADPSGLAPWDQAVRKVKSVANQAAQGVNAFDNQLHKVLLVPPYAAYCLTGSASPLHCRTLPLGWRPPS